METHPDKGPNESRTFPAKGRVRFQSWAGIRSVPVTVLGETPKRYRVRYEEAMGGNYSGAAGAIRLVPKYAVAFADETPIQGTPSAQK